MGRKFSGASRGAPVCCAAAFSTDRDERKHEHKNGSIVRVTRGPRDVAFSSCNGLLLGFFVHQGSGRHEELYIACSRYLTCSVLCSWFRFVSSVKNARPQQTGACRVEAPRELVPSQAGDASRAVRYLEKETGLRRRTDAARMPRKPPRESRTTRLIVANLGGLEFVQSRRPRGASLVQREEDQRAQTASSPSQNRYPQLERSQRPHARLPNVPPFRAMSCLNTICAKQKSIRSVMRTGDLFTEPRTGRFWP